MATLPLDTWTYTFNGFIDAEQTWVGLGDLFSTLVYHEFTTAERYDIGLTITARSGPNIVFNNSGAMLLDAATQAETGFQTHLFRYAASVDPGTYRAGVYMEPNGAGYTLGNFTLEIIAIEDDGAIPIDLGELSEILGNPVTEHGAFTPDDQIDKFRFTLDKPAQVEIGLVMASNSAHLFAPNVSIYGGGDETIIETGTVDGVTTYELSAGFYTVFLSGSYFIDEAFVEYDTSVTFVQTLIGTLFTSNDDTVNFNTVLAAEYTAGTQYNASGGNDFVVLPGTAGAAAQSGFVPGTLFDAGDGNDTVIGLGFDDEIWGGLGNDALIGGGGSDTLRGEDGADTLDGGAGADNMAGSTGDDTYIVDNAGDAVFEAAGEGYDTVVSSVLALNIANYSNIESIRLTGSAALSLKGNAGANTLIGNDGANVLTGGKGRDIMTGGAGADDFDFNSKSETGKTASKRDKITDFQRKVDDIDLRGIDASTKKGGDQKFKFIGTQDFHKTAGELRYEKSGSKAIVEGDINGDGRADFQIELTGVKTLASGDFIL